MSSFRFLLAVWLVIAASSLAFAQLPADPAVEGALLEHTNAERSMRGLPALVPDEALARAARQHAREMAELGYMAHESPRAETRTVSHRLNQAGAVVQGVGENLALLSGVPDIAVAAVAGWMDSPGHRRNILGDFTHAGFGVAQGAGGSTYVVQVLGLKVVDVVSVAASRSLEQVYQLDIGFTLSAPREVAFWFGEDVRVPGLYGPGSQTFSVELQEPRLRHVSSGVREAGSPDSAVFIAADSGWFDPAVATWSPAADGNDGTLRIDRVSGGWAAREFVLVTLQLAQPPPGAVGVWLDDDWLHDVAWQGSTLTVRLPLSALGKRLQLGVEQGAGTGSYSVVVSMEIVAGPAGLPAVRLLNPGT